MIKYLMVFMIKLSNRLICLVFEKDFGIYCRTKRYGLETKKSLRNRSHRKGSSSNRNIDIRVADRPPKRR